VPLSEEFPDTANLLTPSPRQVSLELLTRTIFQPATILNVIAAAWIQFMVHDWFVHKKGTWTHTHDIPLHDGDGWHERPMRVPKTPADPPKVADSKRPPAYINENTHWWDGSHVYGSSPSAQASLRAGRDGKVLVSPSGRLGVDPVTGLEITGFTENGWVGLSLLHALFALEHNAICDELKKHNPLWWPDGRAAARGDGLQRHCLPHLPAHGIAPAQERSISIAAFEAAKLWRYAQQFREIVGTQTRSLTAVSQRG
jgi:hypothetical protein